MPVHIQNIQSDPPLVLQGADPASGMSARVTIFAGSLEMAPQRDNVGNMFAGRSSPVPAGFYVPGLEPITTHADPLIRAEVFLNRVSLQTNIAGSVTVGVDQVEVQMVPDQTDPRRRWPYVSFQLFADGWIRLGYRVTLVQPVS